MTGAEDEEFDWGFLIGLAIAEQAVEFADSNPIVPGEEEGVVGVGAKLAMGRNVDDRDGGGAEAGLEGVFGESVVEEGLVGEGLADLGEFAGDVAEFAEAAAGFADAEEEGVEGFGGDRFGVGELKAGGDGDAVVLNQIIFSVIEGGHGDAAEAAVEDEDEGGDALLLEGGFGGADQPVVELGSGGASIAVGVLEFAQKIVDRGFDLGLGDGGGVVAEGFSGGFDDDVDVVGKDDRVEDGGFAVGPIDDAIEVELGGKAGFTKKVVEFGDLESFDDLSGLGQVCGSIGGGAGVFGVVLEEEGDEFAVDGFDGFAEGELQVAVDGDKIVAQGLKGGDGLAVGADGVGPIAAIAVDAAKLPVPAIGEIGGLQGLGQIEGLAGGGGGGAPVLGLFVEGADRAEGVGLGAPIAEGLGLGEEGLESSFEGLGGVRSARWFSGIELPQ